VCGTMLEEGRALIGNKDEGWEIAEGLVRKGNFWANEEIKIRCGKKGLEDSVWKVWEDVEMVDTFEGKGEEKGKGREEVEMKDVEEEEKVIKKEKGEGKIEVIDMTSGSEEGSGVGLIEEWKVKKEAKERRERNEKKKRELEGMVNRGKDRGMGRKEIMEMKQNFRDYEEVVEDMEYVLGIDKALARCFVMDREIRKVVDLMVSGDSDNRRDMRGEKEEMKKEVERVEVRSEVVVKKGLRERKDLEKKKGTKIGRTYGEVLRGIGSGIAEGKEVTEIMENEGMSWVEGEMEKEKRSGRVVGVVMDSQGDKSEKEWKKEEVAKEVGVAEGAIEGVKVLGNRVKIVMKDREVVEEVEKKVGENFGVAVGGGVVEVKRNENWVGIVVPGMSVERWEGKLEEMREMIEVEDDRKLMRMPRWLANEDRRKALNLKSVGEIAHVARESVRVRLVEEGMNWDRRKIQVKRYVEERQLTFCTKYAMVGHNWWQCERKRLRCNICAVDGHAGWMHRCEKCKVQRKGCEHYRKCAMCGKDHTVAEAREGNCLGVRAEMMRLRSLNY